LEGLTCIAGFILSGAGQNFQSKFSEEIKLIPFIAKVCKCFTTEKQIFRYNQIVTRTAVYKGFNLKTAICNFIIYDNEAAVF
jgi:hypothetical protein